MKFFETNEVDTDEGLKELELFKSLVDDKEKELLENTGKPLPLSAYSTTQLKAELRRRKKEKRGWA